MINQNPTLTEIAELTGFSAITVSRAISNPSKVKPATRDKILKVCEEKGYKVNNVAKGLKNSATYTISVYIPEDITARNPFYTTLVAAIGETLGNLGYSMLLCKKLIPPIACDGMIFTSLDQKELEIIKEISKSNYTVLFGCSNGIDSIDADNKFGLFDITSRAIKRGGKNLLMISIDQERLFIKDRENGFNEAVEKYKVNGQVDRCFNNSADAYKFCQTNFLTKYSDVDTVVCATDDIALGVIRFLNEKGIKIPEQVQVTGYDGFGSETHCFPNIATEKQPIFEIGQLLAYKIISKIKSKSTDVTQTLVKPIFINSGSIKKGE